MTIFWWAVFIIGALALLGVLIGKSTKVQASLNASGYTYPSSPGA